MDETDDIAVANEFQGSLRVKLRFMAVGVEEPVVVRILVMVASDLLLGGSLRESLNVRMEESATISHVLQRDS